MTPQFKEHDNTERHSYKIHMVKENQHMPRLTDVGIGTKSAKIFDLSQNSSFVAQAESVLVGSGTESCIQANRKATREIRPPANQGDDKSSSHHEEGANCDMTLVESEQLDLRGFSSS